MKVENTIWSHPATIERIYIHQSVVTFHLTIKL